MGYQNAVDRDYILIQAAKYLGVAPWELQKQGVHWYKLAIASLSAEAKAAKLQREMAEARSSLP